jgi:hypothetical protein
VLNNDLRVSTLILSKLKGFRHVEDVPGRCVMMQRRRPSPIPSRFQSGRLGSPLQSVS